MSDHTSTIPSTLVRYRQTDDILIAIPRSSRGKNVLSDWNDKSHSQTQTQAEA